MRGPFGLSTAGLAMKIGSECFCLKAKIAAIIGDGEGLQTLCNWKGASSLKPCVSCFNLYRKGSDLAQRQPGFVEVDCSNKALFRRWTPESISTTIAVLNEARDRVKRSEIPLIRLQEMEKSFGFNATSHSIWCDVALGADCERSLLDCMSYDWVHSYLQDGAFTSEAWLYISSTGTSHADLHRYLSAELWRWPHASHHKSAYLHRIFDTYRSSSSERADKLKASSSELLGLFGILRHYVETEVREDARFATFRASFLACCKVLDVLLLCKRGYLPVDEGADALDKAVAFHLDAHKRAYGNDHVKPKHHFMFHIGDQFRRDKVILDTFVIERGHLLVKSIAEHCKNTTNFEASVLAGTTNILFRRAEVATIRSHLMGSCRLVGTVSVASHMSAWGLQVQRIHGVVSAFAVAVRRIVAIKGYP